MLTDTALRIFKPKASMRSESRRLPSPLCLVWEADFFWGAWLCAVSTETPWSERVLHECYRWRRANLSWSMTVCRSSGELSGGQKNFLDFRDIERRQASHVDAVLDTGHPKWRHVVVREARKCIGYFENMDIPECKS